MALPGILVFFCFAVAIPLAHKSTQVPTPQLIYFYSGFRRKGERNEEGDEEI